MTLKAKRLNRFALQMLSHAGATGEQRVPNALPYPVSDLNDATGIVDPKNTFDVMFRNLYWQALVSKTCGVSIYWEIQVIHEELTDLEIPITGIDRDWPFEHFV